MRWVLGGWCCGVLARLNGSGSRPCRGFVPPAPPGLSARRSVGRCGFGCCGFGCYGFGCYGFGCGGRGGWSWRVGWQWRQACRRVGWRCRDGRIARQQTGRAEVCPDAHGWGEALHQAPRGGSGWPVGPVDLGPCARLVPGWVPELQVVSRQEGREAPGVAYLGQGRTAVRGRVHYALGGQSPGRPPVGGKSDGEA
jgi:hypothetical protein